MHCNAGRCNNIEWTGSIPTSFSMGIVAPERSKLECKVCRSTSVCIALCHACIIYVHSTSSEMARACIHLDMHDHHVSNGTCRESLDIAYKCVANEDTKYHCQKLHYSNGNEQTIIGILSPSNGKRHHFASSSLKVVMDQFSILASPNCRYFVSGSK